MPAQRIPLVSTNVNRLAAVADFENASRMGVTRSEFCRLRGINRTTLRTWERRKDKLVVAVTDKECGLAEKLTLGGSGRVPHDVEDELVLWVKDRRREELLVTMMMIVGWCKKELLPDFLSAKTHDACMAWCGRFMKRHGLTIRRVSHSGRKTRPELEAQRDLFVAEVLTYLCSDFLDPYTRLPSPIVLFNMDQTAVYWNFGPNTTVEFVGATKVSVKDSGKGVYRATLALSVCSDGRMLPPHFVFKGEPNKDLYSEIVSYCDQHEATFSTQKNA